MLSRSKDLTAARLATPLLARVALLLGDGLYYETLTTGAVPGDEVDILDFVNRLRAAPPDAG